MTEITITTTIPDGLIRDVLVGLAEFSEKFQVSVKATTRTDVGVSSTAPQVPASPTHPPLPAPALLNTPAHVLRDHFQHDRNGNEPRLAPDGAELQTIAILQVKKVTKGKAPFVGVLYNGGKANCFDPSLWPLLPQSGPVQVWIAESNGYLNIVGVRA